MIFVHIFYFTFFPDMIASAEKTDNKVWRERIRNFKIDTGSIMVNHEKEKVFLTFGKMMNDYIIHGNVQKLLENMDAVDFRDYGTPWPGIEPENIATQIRKQFKKRQGGDYYFIFDILKYVRTHKDIKGRLEEETLAYARYLDIRKYLSQYQEQLEWAVLFLPEDVLNLPGNTYVVSFSFPDDIVDFFFGFQYFVIERNGKLICIGF